MGCAFYLPYYVTKALDNKDLVLFNWNNNNSVRIFDLNHPVYQLLKDDSIKFNSDYADDFEWLIVNGFLVHSNDEKKIALSDNFNDDILNLILLPSGEACNLRCVYCYENHNDKRRMTKEHADILLKTILKSNKKHVHLQYFGGEPMLNLKFISYFSEVLTKEKISYSGSMTTNGVLLNDKTFEMLYQANIKSFQITLDGSEHVHNSLRVSTSKSRNSYLSVINALKTLATSKYQDIFVYLRLNVNENSIQKNNFLEFTKSIEDVIPKKDKRFFILPKAIADYSNLNLKSNTDAEEAYCKFSNEVVNQFEDYIMNNGYFSANSKLTTFSSGYSCYAGNKNSFVITPDFIVRKCTVAFNDPINIVGEIEPDGNIKTNSNFALWTKDYADTSCFNCFLQNACKGNCCPLANIKKSKKNCPPLIQNVNLLTIQVNRYYEQINSITK